ncbi:hypothetical protein RCL1_000389 [Eukaryota sp. TZLM3-RCL]
MIEFQRLISQAKGDQILPILDSVHKSFIDNRSSWTPDSLIHILLAIDLNSIDPFLLHQNLLSWTAPQLLPIVQQFYTIRLLPQMLIITSRRHDEKVENLEDNLIKIMKVIDTHISSEEEKDTTPEIKILLLGLDAAGKTQLLYRYRLNDIITPIPTVGFNIESVVYNSKRFCFWDVGGGCKIQALWKHYFEGTDAIFFVVDGSDTLRFNCGKSGCEFCVNCVLCRLRNDIASQNMNINLCILLNKADVRDCVSADVLREKLDLSDDIPIFSVSAITGKSVNEPLDWVLSL